jgi:bla regulator protein BlaR1
VQISKITIGASLAILTACWLFGQSSPAPLTFEVASIKPSAETGFRTGIQMQPGGGLRVSGISMKVLLTLAYDVREFQIVGGPGWINSDRWDIMAKPAAGDSEPQPTDPRQVTDAQMKTVREQMQQRLQALLAERCQLKIHRETKEESVYALLPGKNGPKIQASDTKGGSGPRIMMGRGMINGQGVQMEMLATVLSNQLGRTVLDRTGLTGRFDLKLQWTPDPGQSLTPLGGAPPPGVPDLPPPDPNGPSIFTAIQEQLGLRLESQKGPVEMIVIDRVEKPSEN